MPARPAVPREPPPNRQLRVQYEPPSNLHFNPASPNRHTRRKITKLAESIRALGMNTPILVDAGMQVISGEARLRSCLELGLTQVPVIRLEHLTPEEAQLFMLAENRFAQAATVDQQALGRLFKDLSVLNLDISLETSGYETPKIDYLIEEIELEVGGQDDLDRPAPAGPPIAQVGDVFWLRDPRTGLAHTLACADALVPENLRGLMGEEKAAVVVTDPPFGGAISGYLKGGPRTKHREFVQGSAGGLSPAELAAFLEAACANIASFARPGALAYVFGDWRGIEVLLRVGAATFAELKNIIVWSKTAPGMGAFYRSQHELIALFQIAGGEHRNNVQLGKHGRNRSNVWVYAGMTSSSARRTSEGDLLAMHPTVKPVRMIADAILDCTERGEIVLDLFTGSGTALIAAQRTGRVFRGLELDPAYVDCALRRWRAFTGEEPVHAVSGLTLFELEKAAEVGR